MKEKGNHWDLFTKKLVGENHPEEEIQLREWMLEAENRRLSEIIGSIKLSYDAEEAIQVKEDIFKKTFHKIFSSNAPKTTRIPGRKFFLSIAAGMALLTGITALFLLLKNSGSDSQLVVITCPSGISTILLPDSSSVTLNAGSTLKYPAGFNKKSRRVSLEGEAFFDVKKYRSHPFIISTESMNFKVLGTTFNISAYPRDKELIVSLLSGSIEVNDKLNLRSLVLHPDEGLTFNTETSEMKLATIDSEYVTGWIKGNLLFKKSPFSLICNMLGRKFGYQFEIRRTGLENKIFTGKFTNNETLPQILDIIKVNESFSY